MTQLPSEIDAHRKATRPINPLFLMRWSPRAMNGDPISDDELFALFEAARWAPSASNNQPWRFIYAKKGDSHWDDFFSLLVPSNQIWAVNAGVLVLVVSKTTTADGKPNPTHSLDTGAAWMSIALEATFRRLAIHGMAGYNGEKAREVAKVPEGYNIEMMIAIGHRAPKEFLPEKLIAREFPSGRKELDELLFSGNMRED